MAEIKKISTELQLLDKFLDTSGDAGTSGQVLSSTGTGINWVSASSGTITGSGTTGYIPKWTGSSALGDSILEVNSALPSSVIIPEYLRHSGDTNTYFGFQSNDTFIVATNNTERLRVDSTGYVGIGTTSPDNTLDVVASDVNITPNAESSAVFRRNGNNYLTILSNASNEGGILFGNAVDDNDGSISYKHNTQSMQFATADAERMRITSTGNVGIGTTSPSALFSVANTTVINGNGTAGWGSSANYGFLTWDGGTVNAAIVKGQNGKNLHLGANNRNNDLVITTAGNVGIGTTSPSEKLEVAGNIVGDGTLNTQGTITVGNGQVVLGGTGRIQGVDTVSASTDAANKAYVDAHGGGLGPFLPLSAGSSYPLTGDLYLKTTNDTSIAREQIIWQTSQGTNRSFIRVGGSYASNALEFGTGNSILGMMLHANAGLSIGTTVATALPPASGLLVQGNVGIGTTSPGAVLSVRNPTAGTSTFSLQHSTTSSVFDFQTGIANITGDALVIKDVANSYDYLTLRGGNVGIGTTSPSELLEIKPGSGGDSKINMVNSSGVQKALIGYDNGNGGLINLYNEAGTRNVVVRGYGNSYFNGGNFGIGTTAPGANLDVRSTDSNYVATFKHSTATGYAPGSILLEAGQGVSRGQGIFHYNNVADENWFTGVPYAVNSEKWIVANKYSTTQDVDTAQLSYALMTIASTTGNVGIGTTNPSQKLHVKGNILVEDNDSTDIVAQIGNSGDDGWVNLYANGTSTAFIGSNAVSYLNGGNVGIGTTSPGEKLEVVGNIRTNVGNGSGFMLTGSSASGLVRNNGTGLALRTNSIDKLIIDNTGSVTFSAYTGTNEQGTPTYLLGTDASGNVVKTNTVPGSAAGPYLPLAGGTMSGNTNHSDNVKDRYGTGNDFQIWHDGSNTFLSNEGEGHLNIINTGDDRDIIFKTDDGSGATTSYMVIDGSAEQTRFYKDTRHTDGIKANFGDSNDLQIYHDGSNSYIKDNGIGDLRFMASNIKFYDNGTAELMAQMIPNGAVELYYNNSKKFETTNTGVSVTGNGIFTGNVGIGTTSPGSKLEVSSGAGANGDSILTISADTDNSTSSSSPKILMLQKGSTKTSLIEMDSSNRTHFSNGDGHYFSGGNVGIGTTSPGYKLDVDGVVRGDRFFVGTNAAASQWAFHARNNNSTADSGIYFNNNSSEIYLRNSSNVIGARIRSNSASYFNGGDVGIGTASPQERLHVSGETHPSIKLSSSSDGNYNVILNCGYRNEALNLSVGGYKVFTTEGFNTPETTHLYSNNSKALSLASNQAATFTSTVTATNFINSSDERLKENIEEVRDNNVEVNWKTFNFKTKKEQKRYGVIAQELEKTNPEFVREDSQGFKSVAYIDLLIAKIAELEARIQKLEK